jgi:hypothetical protein
MIRRAAGIALLLVLAGPLAAPGGENEKEARAPLRLLDFEIEDAAVRRAVEEYTISRALEAVRFVGRREHEEFLLERLPLAAALARHLYPPLEPYNVTEKGPGLYDVDDRGALRGHLRLIAQAPGRRVYFAEGEFRSLAHLLRFNGAMVIALRYAEETGTGGPGLRNEPHLYLRVEHGLVHGLLKLLSPLIRGIIDRRVAALSAAAEAVSARMTKDPAGLYREMQGWPDVTDAQRADFRRQFRLGEE